MTVKQLLVHQRFNTSWTTGKVFLCYSNDEILRKRASGKEISDGELFDPEELNENTLNHEVKPNQWWTEDGDLCIDFYRTW